jgi:hypothetical protein
LLCVLAIDKQELVGGIKLGAVRSHTRVLGTVGLANYANNIDLGKNLI